MTNLRRININCAVAYTANLKHVKELSILIVANVSNKSIRGPIQFAFVGLDEEAINFQIRFLVETSTISKLFEIKREIILRLQEAFLDQENKLVINQKTQGFMYLRASLEGCQN